MVNLKGLGLSPGIKVSSFIHNFETNIGCESSTMEVCEECGGLGRSELCPTSINF